MPKPRKTLVSLDATPYYHCVSRCVRRAFLCGIDAFTGNSYEHRRKWVEDRLLTLASIFAIDIAAYAIMSNHYHVVLRINHEQALDWTESDVIEHWHQLFKGCLLSQRCTQGEILSKAERHALTEQVNEWRNRLMSISWFMRCINEPIARQANHEDKVTYWQSFDQHEKSHADKLFKDKFSELANFIDSPTAVLLLVANSSPPKRCQFRSFKSSDPY